MNGVVSYGILAFDLAEWLGSAWSIILMIVGFSAVIFVHELGHFAMAKLCGVRVDKFAIGFGKELFGYTFGETRYSFNVLPLGGYVKMLGQEDFEIDKEGEWRVKDNPRAFTNKPVGSRMLIVSAGVAMNLLFAALAFMVVFMIGLQTIPPIVGYVEPGSPAHRAGLMPGDRILTIDGEEMDDHSDVKRAIMLADTDRPIRVELRREGIVKPFDVYIEPEYSEEEKVRQIGILPPMTLQVAGVSGQDDYGEEGREDRLKPGDVIVEVDGVKVQNYMEVKRLIDDKHGELAKLVVERPVDPNKPDGPKKQVVCYHRAWMLVVSTGGGVKGQQILGLYPRPLLLQVEPKSPAARAGLRSGDVVVKWGDQWNPTAEECKEAILAKDEDGQYVYAGRNLEVIVRRIGMAKEIGITPEQPTGTILSYGLLKPLLDERDAISETARKDPEAARRQILAILGKQTDDKLLLDAVTNDLQAKAATSSGLDRWLSDLDRETYVVRPEIGGIFHTGEPKIGVTFGAIETDRLVVAKVEEKGLDGKPTPAMSLNLPRGALITQVDGQRVQTWMQLVETFRARAGKEVTVSFVHSGVAGKGKMAIPMCLTAALDLPPSADVVSIEGEKRARYKQDGQMVPVALPHWAAAYEILKANTGKSVSVVYRYGGKEVTKDASGKPLTYAVTAEDDDPWLMRVLYEPLIVYYPERFTLRKSNPVAAMWMGFKKTGNFILQAYKTMEHMIISQNVGVGHISGPVGILRIGHTVAQSGITNLLYFLAFISANLAVINFLPLPIVDGGLMVFLIIEKIRGRPVSLKMQVATQIIGLVLIIGIFVFVTVLDVSKWVGEG